MELLFRLVSSSDTSCSLCAHRKLMPHAEHGHEELPASSVSKRQLKCRWRFLPIAVRPRTNKSLTIRGACVSFQIVKRELTAAPGFGNSPLKSPEPLHFDAKLYSVRWRAQTVVVRHSLQARRSHLLDCSSLGPEEPMSDPVECRDRAAQCVQLATTAGSALQRTVLLNAANSWITLANQAERDIAQQQPMTACARATGGSRNAA